MTELRWLVRPACDLGCVPVPIHLRTAVGHEHRERSDLVPGERDLFLALGLVA
jgi:hypothetical protein